ncbi:DUF359 domain-containing protein [Candidatus Bathyarchaeota archaeon]|nr:MAG: DUF359 domain-containing protein [Candidatus Bathyarchaeota archaeon]
MNPSPDRKVTPIRVLTPNLRKRLKSPLGMLIRGHPDQTVRRLKEIMDDECPTELVSVGDEVSKSMIERGIVPRVLIVDGKIMRKPVTPIRVDVDHVLRVRNPAGRITEDAFSGVREAFKMDGRVKVLVDGEEDLLTLPAILNAPPGSFVVYGQPREGIVLVRVTDEAKEMARRIIEEMEEKKD